MGGCVSEGVAVPKESPARLVPEVCLSLLLSPVRSLSPSPSPSLVLALSLSHVLSPSLSLSLSLTLSGGESQDSSQTRAGFEPGR